MNMVKASLYSYILLSILSFTPNIVASPLATRESHASLSFTLNLNLTATSLADIDRSRAKALVKHAAKMSAARSSGKREVVSVDGTNTAVTYTVQVGVGSPPTNYTLLVDTGSSNTWVGADKEFVQTSTSQDTGNMVSVTYGSGMFSGEEFLDTVTLSSELVIQNQSIGVASISQGFSGVDGIIGLGPVDLTTGTLGGSSETIPTVTGNLFDQGLITSNLVSVSYNPITTEPTTNGAIIFGGTNSSAFTGDITFTPVTSTSPASEFWGIDQSITYGSDTSLLSSTAGIVDTGTTLVLIASDAFQTYQDLTGATLDETTGLLSITEDQLNNLQSLFFNIGGGTFELTANAQLWPRSLNTLIGGTEDSIFLIVSDLGSSSGEGLDFINGYTFLERFYSVFDTDNMQVGFATTENTNSAIN